MVSSRKPDSGCFSTILRHVLCRNGIPTHPSTELDHVSFPKEENVEPQAHGKAVAASLSDRPGIVARLMGLDTLPLPTDPSSVWPRKLNKSPDSVPRSRSVNFMDYLLDVDLSHVKDSYHRRVRTSVSFREDVDSQIPRRRQSHEQELLVLYLDELGNESKNGIAKTKSMRRSPDTCDQKLRESRRARVGKERKLTESRDDLRRRVGKDRANKFQAQQYGRKKLNGKQRGKLIQEKEVMAESKFTRKSRDRGKSAKQVAIVPVESDDSLESISPISVLGIDECRQEQRTGTTRDYVNTTPKKVSSLREKLPQTTIVSVSGTFKRAESSKKRIICDSVEFAADEETDYAMSMAAAVYQRTEEDILKNLSWVNLDGKAEDFGKLREEMCVMVEDEVLNLLLEQLLDDLILLDNV